MEAREASSPLHEMPPLVVVAKASNALCLSALDCKATSLGLVVGMPLANARAMLPALKVMVANESADRKLLEHIADWCDHFTPFVALDLPCGLLLDITGASHLFDGEQAMLDRICASLRKLGFVLHAAIAGTAAAARALAHYQDGVITPPGAEAEAISSLPIEALSLRPTDTHALRRAGLKTIGQAAGRKRSELTARFGADMVTALDHVLGRNEKPISPRIPLPEYMVEQCLAEPIVLEETILATLDSLAVRLSNMLEQRGEGARRLEAVFFRADGMLRRITVETGRPTRDPKIIVRLFREKLGALHDPIDPGFGFDLVRLGACRAECFNSENIGFSGGENEKKEIAFLVDRLAARFGSSRILSFQPNDTHIPEAAWIALPAQYAKNTKLRSKNSCSLKDGLRRPLRLLATPEPVSLLQAGPDAALHFRWRRALHAVKSIEGPERIAMEWWRHRQPQPTRDYFRVEDERGRRFWLYNNVVCVGPPTSPQWFMHGTFA